MGKKSKSKFKKKHTDEEMFKKCSSSRSASFPNKFVPVRLLWCSMNKNQNFLDILDDYSLINKYFLNQLNYLFHNPLVDLNLTFKWCQTSIDKILEHDEISTYSIEIGYFPIFPSLSYCFCCNNSRYWVTITKWFSYCDYVRGDTYTR